MTTIKTFAAACLLATSAMGTLAHAAYPDRPIRLVVPFPPGGSTDVVARLVATKAEKIIGQSIIIDNRGGAGSLIGTEIAAKAPADGYTLLVGQTAYAVNESLMQKLPYDTIKDFTPIALLADHPGVLLAHKSKPYNTFQEFVAYAKAHPGKITYSSAGTGTWPHLAMAMLANDAGLDLLHVPYKGTGPAKIDLAAGRVDVKIEAYATSRDMVKNGTLKILAVTSKARMPELPNVPTVAELGYANYETSYWIGILAPAGTPKDIVARLERAFVEAAKDPAVAKALSEQNIYPRGLPGKDLAALIKSEIAKWATVIKATGIAQQ